MAEYENFHHRLYEAYRVHVANIVMKNLEEAEIKINDPGIVEIGCCQSFEPEQGLWLPMGGPLFLDHFNLIEPYFATHRGKHVHFGLTEQSSFLEIYEELRSTKDQKRRINSFQDDAFKKARQYGVSLSIAMFPHGYRGSINNPY